MSQIEDLLKDADGAAKAVLAIWGLNPKPGLVTPLNPEFNEVVDAAFCYDGAKKLADSYRSGSLHVPDEIALREETTARVFVEKYKSLTGETEFLNRGGYHKHRG